MNLSRIPIIVWFLIPTILIVGVGVWFFSKSSDMKPTTDQMKPDAVSTPVSGTVEYEPVSRTHITAGTAGSDYNSNPPTSGVHWPSPAKNGVFDKPLPDEQVIHNLEHGYVWISYREEQKEATPGAEVKPGLSSDEVKQLVDIVKDDDWKVILTPRVKNDTKIALASWGRLLNLEEMDADKIKDFIKTYRNRGPEKTPD